MFETIHTWTVGLALLFMMGFMLIILGAGTWGAFRRQSAGFYFFAFCFLSAAASKLGSIFFPYTDVEKRYLFDNGSYVTNDCIHIDFLRASFVPETAPLYGYFRPVGSTNDADWVKFIDTTFDLFPVPRDFEFEGAETNDFMFFTTWTPGPAAHTNGVAVVYWRKKPEAINIAAPFRTGIYSNDVRVAPSPVITNSLPTVKIQLGDKTASKSYEDSLTYEQGWYAPATACAPNEKGEMIATWTDGAYIFHENVITHETTIERRYK
jgi:hypothetical protein